MRRFTGRAAAAAPARAPAGPAPVNGTFGAVTPISTTSCRRPDSGRRSPTAPSPETISRAVVPQGAVQWKLFGVYASAPTLVATGRRAGRETYLNVFRCPRPYRQHKNHSHRGSHTQRNINEIGDF